MVSKMSLLRYWISVLFTLVALLVLLALKHTVWVYLSLKRTPLCVMNFAADIVFLVAVIIAILTVSSRLANSVLGLPGTA